jgi:glycolate oxidase iron-sulfur subunit
MRSRLAERQLPGFATQGFAMTPALAPRKQRALELLAGQIPVGARMERRGDTLVFLPAGAAKMRIAFFTTCVMETMFPQTNRQAVRLMVLAGAEVHVPESQTCCGALHAHAGLRREARSLAKKNVAALEPGGFDAIVTDSAGCGAALREYGHLLHDEPGETRDAATRFQDRVRDVSEVLATLGLPEPPYEMDSPRGPSQKLRIGYHDPCHLAHGQRVRQEPRRLLKALKNVELIDLPNSDWCCGSAGVYNLTHPAMADAQLERKLDSIRQVTPDIVIASNPGCLLHMKRGAEESGMKVPMMHLVDVLGVAYPPPPASRA